MALLRSLISALLRKATLLFTRDPITRYDLWREWKGRFHLVDGTWILRNTRPGRPQFSFLVAHKDCIGFLEVCIQGIVRHAGSIDYEILVVDDASETVDLAGLGRLSDRLSVYQFRECGGHPCALQWLYYRARAPHVVILDQDAVLLSNHWHRFLAEFQRRPELLMIGVRDQCRLRRSPQMLHPSFILLNKDRCEARLRPPFFFGPKPGAEKYQFGPEEPYYALFCKALLLNAGSLHYLEQYQTRYGFGTVAYLDQPDQPVIYHQWYSGRVHTLQDDQTIDGFPVRTLREATQRFPQDQKAGAIDLSPVTPVSAG